MKLRIARKVWDAIGVSDELRYRQSTLRTPEDQWAGDKSIRLDRGGKA